MWIWVSASESLNTVFFLYINKFFPRYHAKRSEEEGVSWLEDSVRGPSREDWTRAREVIKRKKKKY